MRHKNDYALAATSARSYNRHWRAHKLSWNEIGKIKYLFDGAIEYMDEVTLAYTRVHFNKLRKVLGFKQDSELTELIEKSEAFRIVRNKETHEMEAFMSPLVGDRFSPTPNQEIEEPAIPYELFFCKANALANDNDRDKISENQRQHKGGIDMHVLLAGNVPKFHITANEEAHQRISNGLWFLFNNPETHKVYFGEFIYAYRVKYRAGFEEANMVLKMFIQDILIDHMSRRVGIENWPSEAIYTWLNYYFAADQIPQVITRAHDNLLRRRGLPKVKI
jgi:hypothetical protein